MTPLEVAVREWLLGVREVPGPGTNSRIAEYLGTVGMGPDDETAWCSAFTNYCHEQAGVPGTDKANARSWMAWGRAVTEPRVGDVVVLWRVARDSWQGHVGFYVGGSGGSVLLLGGNQDDSINITAYSRERLLGVRRLGA